jgi:hypothetical protein
VLGDFTVETALVEPVDVAERGELDVVEAPPGTPSVLATSLEDSGGKPVVPASERATANSR